MTAAVSGKVAGKNARRKSSLGILRAVTWGLHVLVVFLAVFSLFTNRFHLWVDLRLLGGAAATFLKILWVGTVLLVPWCAGPRLSGLRSASWTHGGLSGPWARRLLWPTYIMIACLVANSAYYYRLVADNVLEPEFPVPITVFAALLLAAWALATREWLRRSDAALERAAATWKTQLAAAFFALFWIFLTGGFFLLHVYQKPPREPVDLAVVLGNRVMPDGSASGVLRDRTMAAVDLYKRGMARRLFLSGDVRPAPLGQAMRNEVLAMRQVCTEQGIPEWAITLDPYGVNTRATARNARNYMQTHGLKTVAACSDDFHLYRTAWSFREVGVDAYTVPSVKQAWVCAELASVVREVAAIVVYRTDPSYRLAKDVVMNLKSPRVVVRKSAGVLDLYADVADRGQTLIKSYPCITGGNAGDKEVEGDRKTPIGKFHIVFKNPDSKFHLSLGLDYPSEQIAQRGLKAGLITREQYDGIVQALASDLSLSENQKKLWYTPLGGEIFIHGYAEGRTGTAGCVAVSNPDIDEIYNALPEGTEVEILP